MAPLKIKPSQTKEIRGGLVWIGTSTALLIYATLGFLEIGIPGVADIVTFIQSASGIYIYIAAFIAIFIEGLYLVGSFFPGSSFVLLTAVLSQLVSVQVFIITIITIFVGWCVAGAINIAVAVRYRRFRQTEQVTERVVVSDRLLTTWFPAFRASYEVAQIAEGGQPLRVFMSSVRVKFWASLAAAGLSLLLPFIIDVAEMSNEEGFMSVFGVAAITFTVGVYKIYSARSGNKSISASTA